MCAVAPQVPRHQGRRMRNSKHGGFVLLTLLITAALISSICGMWLLQEQKRMAREREVMRHQAGSELRRALASYHQRNTPLSMNAYPASVDELLLDTRGSYSVRHLRSMPLDPVSRKTSWGQFRMAGRIVCFYPLTTGASLTTIDHAPDKKKGQQMYCHPSNFTVVNPP